MRVGSRRQKRKVMRKSELGGLAISSSLVATARKCGRRRKKVEASDDEWRDGVHVYKEIKAGLHGVIKLNMWVQGAS